VDTRQQIAPPPKKRDSSRRPAASSSCVMPTSAGAGISPCRSHVRILLYENLKHLPLPPPGPAGVKDTTQPADQVRCAAFPLRRCAFEAREREAHRQLLLRYGNLGSIGDAVPLSLIKHSIIVALSVALEPLRTVP
jgi:hypothetical protein